MAHDTNQETEKGEFQWPVSLLFFPIFNADCDYSP